MSQSRRTPDDTMGAFCIDSEAYLEGAPQGPLSGLTFAAKDILDIAGHVTGGGNPDWKATHGAAVRTAWAVQVLVDAGATMVGKTLTDELTRGIFGENVHYGTPINPLAPDRVPGGSSSGSVSAVAGGLVDFALGSDTGGSVRVPASYCGVFGLRTTHGRIPLDGILLQAPSYDTIGWFARDAELFARVGAVLLKSEIKEARPRRLLISQDAFEVADQRVADALEPIVSRVASLVDQSVTERLAPQGLAAWSAQQVVLQAREAWETSRDWIDRVNPRFSFWVSDRYAMAKVISDKEVEAAKSQREAVLSRMDDVFADGTIVCLPTAPTPAPPKGQSLSDQNELLSRIGLLTCTAGTIGSPQINLPLAELDGLPLGLSLMGPRGSDELLISFALQVVAALE